MKKTKLTLLALLSFVLLTGCDHNSASPSPKSDSTATSTTTSNNSQNSVASTKPSSSTSTPSTTPSTKPSTPSTSPSKPSTPSASPSTPSTPSVAPVKKATVNKVYNYTKGTLNIQQGDEIELGEKTITLTFASNPGINGVDIMVNKTVSTMTASEDGLSYSFVYNVADEGNLTIAVSNKQKTSNSGEKITFVQGEHYTILGLTSGEKYNPYTDLETYETYDVKFVVIAEDGYYIDKVKLVSEYGSDDLIEGSDGYYYISYLYSDSTLEVTVQKSEQHAITYVGATEENHVDLSTSVLPTTFMSGIETSFKIKAQDGYAISSLEFSLDSIMNPTDYSDFSLVLPAEDLTITIHTISAVELKYEDNAHVHNVEFYSGLTYSDDYETVTPKDKITSFVPSDRNQFYVVFTVDNGYKVESLTGVTESENVHGYDNQVKTTDGKYVFTTYLKKEDTIRFNVTQSHKVQLDRSSSNVELIFDNDQVDYFEGDSVEFDIAITEGNYKVSKVLVSYMDEGVLKDHIIYAKSYGDHAYSFNMPDCDVTIKVELVAVVKATVSYTNTAGNLVKSVRVSGSESNVTLSGETTTSSDFEVGENITVRVNAGSDHSKKVKATFVGSDGTTTPIELILNVNFGQYEGKFTLTQSGSIKVEEGEAATKRTITLSEGTSVEYYTSNNAESKVESLGDLYDMDVFYFSVKNKAQDGKMLVTTLKIGGEKADLNTSDIGNGITAYRVTVSGDIEISVEEVSGVKFTIDDQSDNFSGNDSDEVFLDPETEEPININNGYVEKGTKFFFSNRSGFTLVSLKIGGQTAVPVEDEILGDYYVATGDVEAVIDFEY